MDKKKIITAIKSPKFYNKMRLVVLALAAGVLIYASYTLMTSFLNYKEDEQKYAEINDMFNNVLDDSEEKKDEDNSGVEFTDNSNEWKWDYKKMLEYNDEAVGYIKLDGTRIQYPIVAHTDNDYYLWRGADKTSNGSGSIFVDCRTAGLEGNMCILYGHNMLDGSMFKDLMDYRNADFCKKHPTIDVYIGYKHYIYYVFSSFSANEFDEKVYKYDFQSESDLQTWINTVYSKGYSKFNCEKPTTKDKIIMCSTCIDDNGSRQIICMYRGEEVVD